MFIFRTSSYYFGLQVTLTGTMSKSESFLPHLTQRILSNKDEQIIEGLKDWISAAKFENRNGDEFELCVNTQLCATWASLKAMDVVQKVQT